MAYDGAAWNETVPTNATAAHEIDDIARDIKIGVRSRLAVEHVWGSSQAATSSAGYHTYISLQGQTGAPSLAVVAGTTQCGLLYAATDGGLLYRHATGTSVPLVSASAERFDIPLTYIDTDGTLVADSDVKIPTQKATKTYVDSKIGVLSGTITHGGIIPLPDGFDADECNWIASAATIDHTDQIGGGADEGDKYHVCTVASNRTVTVKCYTSGKTPANDHTGTANYMIIGLK